jgi:guanosine-3',5'-bis(diphosphate) 3'-pyrophosphohydrolase
VIVVLLSVAMVGEIPLGFEVVISVVGVASVVGFTLDAISAYKVHPVYRKSRHPFFIALARCEHPLDLSRSARTILEGENARETTLYELDTARRGDLGIEHAVWIAAFHMHIILAAGAVLLTFGALLGIAVDIAHVDWAAAAILAAIYTGFAVVSLSAAAARLRSYNAKVLDLTRERTAAARGGTLRSAIATITDGWDKPELGEQAFRVCNDAHGHQTRDDGEPYVFHPVRVALTLRCELDVDQPESLVLALLHDVLEAPVNYRPTPSKLAESFGPDLAEDCKLLATKRGKTRAERDANYAASMAGASLRVKLVKLADRIDNVRSLSTNPEPSKPARYLHETQTHYLGLAAETNPVVLATLEDVIADARSALGMPLGRGASSRR